MKYKKLIKQAAELYDVPKEILASIVSIESRFNPVARRYEKFLDKETEQEVLDEFKKFDDYGDIKQSDDSKWEDDASYGLCQILGHTAIYLGFKPKEVNGFFGLYHPEVNLKLGAKYLKDRYDKYPEITVSNKERWRMAIAAYNAGRGNINEMLQIARNKEGSEKGEQITIEDEGKWQTWEYASDYLPQVTGDSSKYTIAYIKKLEKRMAKYKKEFNKQKDKLETDEKDEGKSLLDKAIDYLI